MRMLIRLPEGGRLEYSWPEDEKHMPRLLQDNRGVFWVREFGSEEWNPIAATQADFYTLPSRRDSEN